MFVRVTLGFATFLLVITVSVYGYGTGAPLTACEGLKPLHANAAQSQVSGFPYTAVLSSKTADKGGLVTVTISGKSFQGFLLQARKVGGDAVPEGTWVPVEGLSQGLACGEKEDSALTHVSQDEKTGIVAEWTAPDEEGEYEIYLTAAETYATWWGPHKVETVAVTENEDEEDADA